MAFNSTAAVTAIQATRQVLEDSITALGQSCAFTLLTGETFTIPGTLKHLLDDKMTDGLSQDKRRLTVSCRVWDAAAPAGREPEKGDEVLIANKRHAVSESDLTIMSGIRMYYRIRLKG